MLLPLLAGCPTYEEMCQKFDQAIVDNQLMPGQDPLAKTENYAGSTPHRIASCVPSNSICIDSRTEVNLPFVILNQTTGFCEYRQVLIFKEPDLSSIMIIQKIANSLDNPAFFIQDGDACDLTQPTGF